MARVDSRVRVCGGLFQVGHEPSAWPFTVVYTIDEQLGLTDGVVQCNSCQRYYLLELTRWPATSTSVRVMRVLTLHAQDAKRFLSNTARDYCDVQRHQQELRALQVSASLSPWQLTLDVTAHELVRVDKLADTTQVDLVSWRQQEN